MNYTKGPWMIKQTKDKHETPYIVADGPDTPGIINVCKLTDCYLQGYSKQGEIQGNAQLIAVAPEMYECLSRIRSLIDSGDWKLPEGFCETEVAWINDVLAKVRDN